MMALRHSLQKLPDTIETNVRKMNESTYRFFALGPDCVLPLFAAEEALPATLAP